MPPAAVHVAEYAAPAVIGPVAGVQLTTNLGTVTVSVAVTVLADCAPEAVTVITQLWAPATTPEGLTETLTVAGIDPFEADKPIPAQSLPSEAPNEVDPAGVELVTEKLLGAGAGFPTW